MDAVQMSELARSLRRAQWLVAELDHNRSPVAVEQAVAGLRLELTIQLNAVGQALAVMGLGLPAVYEQPHSGLPPAPEALF